MPTELHRLVVLMDRAQYPWIATLIVAAGTALVALLLHNIVAGIARRLTRKSLLMSELLQQVRDPMALVAPLIGLEIVWGVAPDDLYMIAWVRHINSLLLILALTWTGVRIVHAVGESVLRNNVAGRRDVYSVRRVQTQARVFTRILIFLVMLLGVSAALMTFPSVRQIGTSMLASAGVAGIVIGFAARPVLSNLLAGIQIALTQPIRIEDVVIVENEWGWIEEITSTYVTVRVWDQRRLVVPLNYFIEKPFQNWTRNSSELIGTVFWWVDYRMPLEPLREELKRLCENAPEWDGRLQMIQVVEATERAVQLRALVTAPDAPMSWDLRCRIREGMIDFIQREYPQYLPRIRNELDTGGADGHPLSSAPVAPPITGMP
jgi:small-conductance mechanosensitive channel